MLTMAPCLAKVSSLPNETIAQMGVRARDYVSQTFSIDRYLEEMLDLYQSLGGWRLESRV